ncbi:MAG: nucleotidyltransferase domain-containing protein [Planctomycetota bacterium]
MILSIGTRVVSQVPIAGVRDAYPVGTLAVVVEPPLDAEHAYRVRLPDGFETNLTRTQFVLLRTMQNEGIEAAAAVLEDHELAGAVIYRCLVGSRAYGLATESSDTDTRGVYLPPADRHWSLYGVPEQLENKVTDEVYWEIQKFLVLALKANPNILEVLYSPDVLTTTDLGNELLGIRESFLSKLVYQTYNGYVMSQFTKLNQRLERGDEVNWKHAMHLIRLLISGIRVLREAVVPVRVSDEHRDDLLTIRSGRWALEDVDRWRLELQSEFEAAYRETSLPDRPDYDAANAFLLRARRAVL